MKIGDCELLGLSLVCTCGGCPEQYDVYLGGEQVGYLRLRHGHFTADALDGELEEEVYSAAPRGDGNFDPGEREAYLTQACMSILAYRAKQSALREPEPQL
jgi:hypothetical protein